MMLTVISGILLSSELFYDPWFLTLTAFVAFNTIVFVGLSFGRILYWPRPLIDTGAQAKGDGFPRRKLSDEP